MKIVGYSDPLTVEPGDRISFMVSCEQPSYQADIVRLIHGDENPRGPGFKEEQIATQVSGEYPGRVQPIRTGSYLVVPDDDRLRLSGSFTLAAWIYPTTPDKGEQALLAKWADGGGAGYGLFIGADRALQLWIAGGGGMQRTSTGRSLKPWQWYFVAGAFDAQEASVRLWQIPKVRWPGDDSATTLSFGATVKGAGPNKLPLLIGACWESAEASDGRTHRHFNGKIDGPRMYGRPLREEELAQLMRGEHVAANEPDLTAAWDFGADIGSRRVSDISLSGLHGRTVNMPARGMTSHNWTAREMSFADAPDEYGAIYFHDDDLADAGWAKDFEMQIPAGMKSGVYAARLRSGEHEDHVPFFVRPPRGRSTSPVLFLAPTNSYLAYGNEHQEDLPLSIAPLQNLDASPEHYQYVRANRLAGLYDFHPDGSGHAYASWLRPVLNFRPKHRMIATNCPFQFPADLHLLDWMEHKGFAFDVVTDQDLHYQGAAMLKPYKVVVTGTHPEYWSGRMLDSLEAYLQQGGRLMYMGGNGFYWVTSFDPEQPQIIEIRRWHGTGVWEASPGEYHHSTTGEPGGLWRFRGRPPQKLAGVGFTAQGVDRGRPFRRLPGSFDPRAAFIFKGIGKDELIGDFDSLAFEYGAAGMEIDRLDLKLGSPPNALILAESWGHSNAYQQAIEEVTLLTGKQGGEDSPLVRAEMVYFEIAGGGAVFSTGSISWCGCLSYNGYANNVSQITENVLRRFSAGAAPALG